jgi:hypothetical protein
MALGVDEKALNASNARGNALHCAARVVMGRFGVAASTCVSGCVNVGGKCVPSFT